MQNDSRKGSSASQCTSLAASELNNMLDIISGTSALIENIWDGNKDAEKYFEMLRVSVERAVKITAELTEGAGGSNKKVLLNPDLGSLNSQKATTPSSGARQLNILVVDDESMALVLAKRILSEAGFEVVTAQSGFECLDLFRSRPSRFDLVLLDLTMPFMDGEETFDRLKTIRPDVIVLLSAGFVAQERLDRMVAAGMAGFLRKPHSPSELVSNIKAVLEGVKMSMAGCATAAKISSF